MLRLYLIHIDVDSLPMDILKYIDFRYDLSLAFAHDEVEASMTNILHLSKEGAKGIQTYELKEISTDTIIDEYADKSRKRRCLDLRR